MDLKEKKRIKKKKKKRRRNLWNCTRKLRYRRLIYIVSFPNYIYPMSHNLKFTTRLLLRSKSKVRNHTRIDSGLSFNYICPYDPREEFLVSKRHHTHSLSFPFLVGNCCFNVVENRIYDLIRYRVHRKHRTLTFLMDHRCAFLLFRYIHAYEPWNIYRDTCS